MTVQTGTAAGRIGTGRIEARTHHTRLLTSGTVAIQSLIPMTYMRK